MRSRVLVAVTAVLLAVGLWGCVPRIDLTEVVSGEETTSAATGTTAPFDKGEMAAYAWEIYREAIGIEEAFATYDLYYESTQTMSTGKSVVRARVVRVGGDGEEAEMLLQVSRGGEDTSGYYKNGVGYFAIEGKKYWKFTNESDFLSEFGFSEDDSLAEEVFAEALVAENEDGTRTVSCPMPEPYASQYAEMTFGSAGSERQVDIGVTVKADGTPVEFTRQVAVSLPLYGTVRVESVNRYDALDGDVVLTPPDDLDEYTADL